jgi:hypothetical protein
MDWTLKFERDVAALETSERLFAGVSPSAVPGTEIDDLIAAFTSLLTVSGRNRTILPLIKTAFPEESKAVNVSVAIYGSPNLGRCQLERAYLYGTKVSFITANGLAGRRLH